jgi:hypothetical protein
MNTDKTQNSELKEAEGVGISAPPVLRLPSDFWVFICVHLGLILSCYRPRLAAL